MNEEDFSLIMDRVKKGIKGVACTLLKEIGERFPLSQLLQSLSIMFPQFWHEPSNHQKFNGEGLI